MKFLAVFLAFFLVIAQAAIIPAGPYLIRTPQHDSAIIKSDRLGGNFAFSVTEGHAYAAVSPVVQSVATPVTVTQTYVQSVPIISYGPSASLAINPDAVPSYALPMEHRMPTTIA